MPDLATSFNSAPLFYEGITLAAIIILGFSVFFNDRQSASNRTFLFFSILSAAWSLTSYLGYVVTNPVIGIWVWRSVMFFATWYSFSLLRLFYTLPQKKIEPEPPLMWVALGGAVLTSLLTLTPLVFARVTQTTGGIITAMANGPGIYVFGAVVSLFIIGGASIFIRKIIQSRSPDEHTQFIFVLAGSGVTFLLYLTFNFLAPAFLGKTQFVQYGGIFTLPFIVSVAYAIVRHKLLSIKIISTQFFAFLTLITTFFDVLLSTNLQEVIIRSFIFAALIVFSVLIIRSVYREVDQRIELEKVTAELQNANEKLQEVDKLKSEFVSFAAHQIKSPIAVVKDYATLIFDGTMGDVSDDIKDVAHKIKNSSDRLIQLVNNLLDVRKIEEGKMEFSFENVDLAEFVKAISEEFQPLAKDKNLDFTLTTGGDRLMASIDKQKFAQVLQNLIDNAVKYTDAGAVRIDITARANEALIAVADSGRGMSPETISKIFNEFERGGEIVKAIQGTGLGLFIAKQIVEAHKGRIWAESTGEGKGSTFKITIPLIFQTKNHSINTNDDQKTPPEPISKN